MKMAGEKRKHAAGLLKQTRRIEHRHQNSDNVRTTL